MFRFLIISLLFLGMLQTQAQESGQISVLDFSSFKEAIATSQVQLIDVRTSKEYRQGFITPALNIPIANHKNFNKAVQTLDKEQPIYVYCYSGVRSKRASKLLRKLGFKKIYDFTGGWKAWTSL